MIFSDNNLSIDTFFLINGWYIFCALCLHSVPIVFDNSSFFLLIRDFRVHRWCEWTILFITVTRNKDQRNYIIGEKFIFSAIWILLKADFIDCCYRHYKKIWKYSIRNVISFYYVEKVAYGLIKKLLNLVLNQVSIFYMERS